jgi:hypothetical protein
LLVILGLFDLLRENKYHEVRHEINRNNKPQSIPIVLQEMPSFNNVSLPVVKPTAFNDNVIQVEELLKGLLLIITINNTYY